MAECTHGYHSMSIHMATRYPNQLSSNTAISSVFPKRIWFAIGFSVGILSIVISIAMQVYEHVEPSMVRLNVDLSQILIRLIAGFTEPDDDEYFKTFSTGDKSYSIAFLAKI